jgi:thiosulfate/3-mercaptopyruvate sulfurtransferase
MLPISKSVCAARAIALAALTVAAFSAGAAPLSGPLVDTQWLADNRGKVVILDARKDPQPFLRKAGGGGEVAGVQACGAKGGGATVSGHIPGSALMEWKDYAINQKVGGIELLDTVPAKADFEALMQASGVNKDSAIVIAHSGEDMNNVAFGTRLYWTVKYFGHDNVALLDGGVAKWAAEKRDIEYGRPKTAKGNWQASAERRELLATLADVEAAVAKGGLQLLDNRTPEFYMGLTRKPDKVARNGHIAGARNLPYTLLVKDSDKGSTFYKADDLRKIAEALGIDPKKPSAIFCNTGHLSSAGWFAMSEILRAPEARLYDGSMNEWAADPARAVTAFKQE